MIVEVTTLTGSVYRIDYELHTWERTEHTPLSGQVRRDGGMWTEVSLMGEGFPLVISGPPVDLGPDHRKIITSTVVKVEPIELGARNAWYGTAEGNEEAKPG